MLVRAVAIGVVLVAVLAPVVAAHDGAPSTLEIPAERLPAGSELPLIGLDFFPSEVLRVRLQGAGVDEEIGVIRTRPDGHFETMLELPDNLPIGPYTVDAISTSGIIVRATFESDPTAPQPSYRPLFPSAAQDSAPSSDFDFVPLVALGLAIAGFGLLALRTRRFTADR